MAALQLLRRSVSVRAVGAVAARAEVGTTATAAPAAATAAALARKWLSIGTELDRLLRAVRVPWTALASAAGLVAVLAAVRVELTRRSAATASGGLEERHGAVGRHADTLVPFPPATTPALLLETLGAARFAALGGRRRTTSAGTALVEATTTTAAAPALAAAMTALAALARRAAVARRRRCDGRAGDAHRTAHVFDHGTAAALARAHSRR
jgi:hypothetical protein